MENVDMFNNATAQLTFHDFLGRMRDPSAADLVRSIKNFIGSFLSNPPDPERDSQGVQEFMTSTESAFRAHSLWAGATEEEFESSGEGLEKYLMTKLFSRAFAPLPEDAEQDQRLSEKMAILLQFIAPEHLDIRESFQNEKSWLLAQKELLKINTYKAPRDKLVCILNCCCIINNLLLNVSMATNDNPPGADDFLPILIYVVIKANPPQLHSNLLYIQRYRHQKRLVSEASYFYTNLVSAESFIANLDSKSLTMDPIEFEKKMMAGRVAMEVENRVASTMSNEKTSSAAEKLLNKEKMAKTPPKDIGKVLPTDSLAKGEKYIDTRGPHVASLVEVVNQEITSVNMASIEKLEAGASAQVLEADKSGQLAKDYPFLYASAGDLRVVDVESLLHEYKELVLRYVSLRKAVEGSTQTEKPPTSSSTSSRQVCETDTQVGEVATESLAQILTRPQEGVELFSGQTSSSLSEAGLLSDIQQSDSRSIDTAGNLGEEIIGTSEVENPAIGKDEFEEVPQEDDSKQVPQEVVSEEVLQEDDSKEAEHDAVSPWEDSPEESTETDLRIDSMQDQEQSSVEAKNAQVEDTGTRPGYQQIAHPNANQATYRPPQETLGALFALIETGNSFPEFELVGLDELEKLSKESHTPELLEYMDEGGN